MYLFWECHKSYWDPEKSLINHSSSKHIMSRQFVWSISRKKSCWKMFFFSKNELQSMALQCSQNSFFKLVIKFLFTIDKNMYFQPRLVHMWEIRMTPEPSFTLWNGLRTQPMQYFFLFMHNTPHLPKQRESMKD